MIKMSEYAKRRKKLMQHMGPHGIAILPSALEQERNGDAYFPFRQNSDFYYLTGFKEPESMLVLSSQGPESGYILFNRIRDAEKEIWDGPRAGQDGAKRDYHADFSFEIHDFAKKLPELLAGKKEIYTVLGLYPQFDRMLMDGLNQVRRKIRSGALPPISFIDIANTLHEMRLLKSPAEISVLKKAIDITAKAHVRAIKKCKPNLYEYQLEAEILHEFNSHGARSAAYSSIVGSGKNSCVLHYIDNNKKIADGDLVLIDAGAEYENYAADITRTFPANGKFTAEQKAVYEIVLEAQTAAIKTIKPGTPWDKMQEVIVKIITQGLVDLRILKGRVDDLIEKNAYFPYYMHRSGHWLGLDVHDVGYYRINDKWRKLMPGMVLTVEPGIYISPGKNIPKRFENIGVRIEDDVLVTTKNHEVLSDAIPKKIADIEAIMR